MSNIGYVLIKTQQKAVKYIKTKKRKKKFLSTVKCLDECKVIGSLIYKNNITFKLA